MGADFIGVDCCRCCFGDTRIRPESNLTNSGVNIAVKCRLCSSNSCVVPMEENPKRTSHGVALAKRPSSAHCHDVERHNWTYLGVRSFDFLISPSGVQLERTSLAWQRTAVAGGIVVLILFHAALYDLLAIVTCLAAALVPLLAINASAKRRRETNDTPKSSTLVGVQTMTLLVSLVFFLVSVTSFLALITMSWTAWAL